MSTDAFGDKLGTFRGMYPCSYLLEDGHLAVGSKSVGYRCSSTSCARMIMIGLNDIGSVNGVGATGLIISTTSGQDYVFKGFAGRDAVMKLVNDEKNKTLRGAPSTFTKSYATRVQHRRRSSFPTIPVNALPMGEFEKDDMQETLDIMKDMTKAVEQNKTIIHNERSGKSERPPPDVRKSVTTKSMRFFAAVAKNRTDKDLDKAWAKLKAEKNKTYPTVVLSVSISPKCSINIFLSSFHLPHQCAPTVRTDHYAFFPRRTLNSITPSMSSTTFSGVTAQLIPKKTTRGMCKVTKILQQLIGLILETNSRLAARKTTNIRMMHRWDPQWLTL